MPFPGASCVLSYPSAISLSTRSVNHLADLIRARGKTFGPPSDERH